MNDSPDSNTMKQMPRIKEEAMFSERGEDDYINFDYMLNIKRTHVHQKSQNGSNEELEAGSVVRTCVPCNALLIILDDVSV